MLPGREQELAGDGLGKVAIGLLDQQAILPIKHVAVERQLVGIARQPEKIRPLPDQVERQVGEAEIHLQRGRVAAPLAEPLAKDQRVFAAVWFGLLVALAYFLTHLFSGRAAFLHLGAVMGTVMTFNVFFRIIPSQRHMIASTKAGTPVDTSYGIRAKGRSVHNHYMTFPVLFTMLSNATISAACPEAVATAARPPSSAATRSSNTAVVGFERRV